MRNVTIIRTKSSVACLATLKVYIEDPLSEEVKIGGVACRKIGELKNGEERNFVVGEEAAKIYVIADLLSKNLSNEFYQLPEGTEDIVLSGKCVYNPLAGNAFRFDGNSDEAVKKNRKKNTTRGIIIFVVALLVGIAVGVLRSLDFASAKTFSGEGMEITLTDSFIESDDIRYTLCYSSSDALVMVLKEQFSSFEGFGDYTLEEYFALLGEANGMQFDIQKDGDLVYCEYDAVSPSDNNEYHYTCFVYKSADSFWLVEFATAKKDKDKMRDDIFSWASSVKFD